MDILELFQKIKPNVKKATLNQYIVKLSKFYDNGIINNLDFIFDPAHVIKFLDQYKEGNTKRSYLSPIIILLRYYKELDEKKENNSKEANQRAVTLEIYEKMNEEYKSNYEKNRNIKTENEVKNWLVWKDIIKIRDGYIKTLDLDSSIKQQKFLKNRKEEMILENALITSLYTFLPPVRIDYNNMEIYRNVEKSELPIDKNYLLINKKEPMKIILNSFKTDNKTTKQEIKKF